jgi:Lon protease-like protein
MPLNIFEPRYMALVDDALRTDRLIGMIQPDEEDAAETSAPRLYGTGCAGRITQLAETGDGRYLVTLTGVARFSVLAELAADSPYRQCQVDFDKFVSDFTARAGEDLVDREAVLDALRRFAKANELRVDWKGIEEAPNEALVNALAMMSPFGTREKQALLEAPDLKSRAEILVAITEFELAKTGGSSETPLQ